MGLALHNYIESRGSFPHGYGWNGWGPMAMMLPQLDQIPRVQFDQLHDCLEFEPLHRG